jgi:hypothetical protein
MAFLSGADSAGPMTWSGRPAKIRPRVRGRTLLSFQPLRIHLDTVALLNRHKKSVAKALKNTYATPPTHHLVRG